MRKYIFIFLYILTSIEVFGQTGLSNTENYVYTKNCLDPSCLKKSEVINYYDGLGKIRQIVGIKETPGGNDLVLPTLYDDAGKKTRDYLPIPQTGSTGGALYQQSNSLTAFPVSDAVNFYSGEKIFSEKTFESSPLNRLKQKIQTGTEWSNKPVFYDYALNVSGDKIRNFKVVTTWENGTTKNIITDAGIVEDSKLYKNSAKDEDGNESVIFINTKGQTILERKVKGNGDYADVYYLYNKFDHLVFILPPLASATPDIISNLDKQNELLYQNKYDGRGRLVEKKLPGKGWEYMVYDNQDRLVATQDANLKEKGQWLYTKYDQFGRVALTGLSMGGDRNTEQGLIDGISNNNVKRTDFVVFNRQGMDVLYDPATTYPHASKWITLLSVNYYDTYPPNTPSPQTQIFGQNVLQQPGPGNNTSLSTQGLILAFFTKNIDNDSWTKNYTFYDTKEREISTISVNYLGGYTKTETELDFTGVPLKSYTLHKRKSDETGVVIKERFLYDDKNRLKKHYHQVDDNSEELLSDNTYNEISQLINKKVGNNIQSIDYDYNIRGWLTGINREQLDITDLGGKLFSYKVKYTHKDGITNPDPVLFAGKNVVAKYNGNIAEIDWRSVEAPGIIPSLTPKRYGYAYDSLDRLTAGFYQNPSNPYSKENTESMDYDLNGNITGLYRTSVMENGSTIATKIDDLVYSYNGNRAVTIKDNSLNSTGYEGVAGFPMEYDANGNLKNMMDKQITGITYNYLNLPTIFNIGFDPVTIQIKTDYRADGVKLRKTNVKTSVGFAGTDTTTEVTDYLDGFHYYKKESTTSGGSGGGTPDTGPDFLTSIARALEPQAFTPIGSFESVELLQEKTPYLQFFPTSEGFYDYLKNQYIYQYKDLYGNVRISFAKNSEGVLEILDSNDYYPYGMNHLKTGYAFFGTGNYKSYKFLGQELQETGFYDMNARFYMPDVGRFMTHDPLSSSTLEPYGYAYGNPLFFMDATGLRSDPINGGNGPGGPGDELKANELGGSDNPYQIQEIVLNPPIRAMASSTPNNCSYCYVGNGNGMLGNLNIPKPQIQPVPLKWDCGYCNDHGVSWMGPMDIVGMLAHKKLAESVGERDASFLMMLANTALMATGTIAKSSAPASPTSSNLWRVGAYKKMRGLEKGLDAHHVGQSALMKRLIANYEHENAPSILVPKAGHRTKLPEIGRMAITRGDGGFTSARQVLARDIFELRRVYGNQGIPNSALQELVQMNKTMYPDAFKK